MLFVDVIFPVFVIAFSGYVLEKRSEIDIRSLANSALYLFAPSLVFSALMKSNVAVEMIGQLTLFMISYTLLMCILAWLTARLCNFDNNKTRAFTLSTSMMNIGNFGLPLVFFAYGEKALDVSVVLFVLFNIPLSTLAIVIAQDQGVKWYEAIKNTLKIPIFYGVVLAFVCKIIGWSPPGFILKATDLLGQAAIPLMLVLLGMQLSRSKLSRDWAFFSLATTIRLIAGPLIAIALVLVIGLDGIQRKVVILQTSTPSAVLPLLYCMRFGTCPELVSGTILTTTLCSGLTLTGLLYWLN